MDNLEAVKALIVKQDLMNQNVELAVAKLERMVSVDFHQNSVEWKDKLNKLKSCQVEANADIEAKISKLVDNYASDEVAWHVDPPPPALGRVIWSAAVIFTTILSTSYRTVRSE